MPAPALNVAVASAVAARFEREFGGGGRRFFAPGRVDLLGAHVDYNGGDVLAMAIDRGIYLAMRQRADDRSCLVSLDVPQRFEVALGDLGDRADPAHGWARYPLGVWARFQTLTGSTRGFDAVFGGDLPMASGLSSSAALEVVTALGLDRLNGTGWSGERIASIAHDAETRYVQVQCGIMDQFASALCRPDQVLLLHCQDATYEHVPLDAAAAAVLVMDTRKSRELAASEYNRRVRECAQAHAVLRAVADRPCLAAYTEAEVAAAGGRLAGTLLRRARHVVTEMRRVAAGVEALRRGDLRAFGEQMNASHFSARDDYEVSCRELDAITAAARGHRAVLGARQIGAGFGGCAVALVEPGQDGPVARHVRERFVAECSAEPVFHALRAGGGAREL
jgi:galactokinase